MKIIFNIYNVKFAPIFKVLKWANANDWLVIQKYVNIRHKDVQSWICISRNYDFIGTRKNSYALSY